MGGELLDAIVSWKTFVVSLLVFGLYPGAVLRLIVLAYPRDDPRRRELLAELYGVPRLERPYWVMEQLEVALFEGLGERIRRRIKKLRQPEGVTRFRPEALVKWTSLGIAVRSKSEVIVADVLTSLGISYEYERPLHSPSDPNDFRLPDFTVTFEGDEYYWEHLGMLDLPVYAAHWERKRLWYEKNGYSQRLITSADHPGAASTPPSLRASPGLESCRLPDRIAEVQSDAGAVATWLRIGKLQAWSGANFTETATTTTTGPTQDRTGVRSQLM